MTPARPIAPNITDDGKRLIAVAQVGRGAEHRRKKRFPRTTPISAVQAWLEATRTTLRAQKYTTRKLKGTLVGEVGAYLARLPPGASRRNVNALLRAWLLALGDVSRRKITAERLEAIITAWIETGAAASTLKHRRRALAQFLESVGDRELAGIVRRLRLPRPPRPVPHNVDMNVLHAIVAGMDQDRGCRHPGRGGRGFRNKARARLLLMLWTGLPIVGIKRLSPTAIDVTRGTITFTPRRKALGAPAVTVPLIGDRARAAAVDWLRAFAWGDFDTRALGRAFHRAVRAYIAREAAAGRTVIVPADLSPKHTRHSFGCWLIEQGVAERVVQDYLQHADPRTTRIYLEGVVSAQMRAAAEAVEARLRNVTPTRPPNAPQISA